MPPDTNMFMRLLTAFIKNSASSRVILPISTSFSMVKGLSENFLIVTTGPFIATGCRTTLILDPSSSLASTIGLLSFTVLFTLDTMFCTRLNSLSLESNLSLTASITPFLSTNMASVPFIMISLIVTSSRSG